MGQRVIKIFLERAVYYGISFGRYDCWGLLNINLVLQQIIPKGQYSDTLKFEEKWFHGLNV